MTASGQTINKHKTSLFFSKNTSIEVKREIRQLLGARVMNECDKYLGLPMASVKSKVGTFKELHEKITKRVLGQKKKVISKAGQEVLIKTMAQAIPTYLMSLFKLPKTLCDNINSSLAKYWWARTKMRGRFIGLIGRGALIRKRVEWGFGTFMLSILLCLQNRLGG